MEIIKNYKKFMSLNESLESDKDMKSMLDVPKEVIETAKEISSSMFDKVRKPHFEFSEGLLMKFFVTPQDLNFIDENAKLRLDISKKARMKREYDVYLVFIDSITETCEVKYKVVFNTFQNELGQEIGEEEADDDLMDDDEMDEYEKPDYEDYDYDEDYFDDTIKNHINKNTFVDDVDDIEEFD
jgi:hypothetical protein